MVGIVTRWTWPTTSPSRTRLRVVATIKALQVSTAQMQSDLQEARETIRKARRLSETQPATPTGSSCYRSANPNGVTPRRCCARSRRAPNSSRRPSICEYAGFFTFSQDVPRPSA